MSQKAVRQNRVVLIAGPTASGKSALAVSLARRAHGVIINADAMQVYRPLSILTARPIAPDLEAAPHQLYGHVSGNEAYSVAHWRVEAEAAIVASWDRQLLPIVVGGTGLYFRALEQGLAVLPPIPDEIREKWRQALIERGSVALHQELAARAPENAGVLLNTDSHRIVRALEVVDATGRSLIDWQREASPEAGAGGSVLAGAEVTRVVLVPDRAWLRQRINERFELMVKAGALDEVKALMKLGLAVEAPINKAIGVSELARVVAGESSLEEVMPLVQARTRQFAKRQLTWFRNQMADWAVLDPNDEIAVAAFLAEW